MQWDGRSKIGELAADEVTADELDLHKKNSPEVLHAGLFTEPFLLYEAIIWNQNVCRIKKILPTANLFCLLLAFYLRTLNYRGRGMTQKLTLCVTPRPPFLKEALPYPI
jgi:hypothetical protein